MGQYRVGRGRLRFSQLFRPHTSYAHWRTFRWTSTPSTPVAKPSGPQGGDDIVVALSGGVDSSVAAYLLAKTGRGNVRGVFMKNWDTSDEEGRLGCEWEKDWEDVRRVGRKLGIPVEMADLSREYWHQVWDPSLKEWELGGTPNPDVLCNRHIKFGALANRIFHRHPTAWLATGHYARLETRIDGRVGLLRNPHHRKDQSYYLAMSSLHVLARTLFPLGCLSKAQVRQIAESVGLHTAQKSESMGVCFIEPKGRFSRFLEAHLRPSPGVIIDEAGRHLGAHQGLWQYTIGERCRSVSGQASKMFVARKDTSSNQIIVVPGNEHPALFTSHVEIDAFHWLHGSPPCHEELASGLLAARIRTGDPEGFRCWATADGTEKLTVRARAPQHGVSAGQVLVMHRGEEVLGGGIISRTVATSLQCPVAGRH